MLKIGIDGHNLEKARYGVGQYIYSVLKAASDIPFAQKNFQITLYFHKKIPQGLDFPRLNLKKKLIKLPGIRPSFTLFYNFLIPYWAWRDKIDIFFFPSYMLPLFYWKKAVVVMHDVAYEAHPEWFPKRYLVPYKILSRWAVRKAEAIVTPSEFSKKEIVKYYKAPAQKIFAIPLGLDPQFRPVEDKSILRKTREKYGVKKEFILFAGQIFTRRYVKEAMVAFFQIAPEFPGLQFLVIGQNRIQPYFDLEKLVKNLNQKAGRDIIVRYPYAEQKDLQCLYSAACLTIWISSYEGFGLPPVESVACGTPVLTAPYKALSETLGSNVFFVKRPSDIQELAQVLRQALTNSKKRQAIVNEGQKAAQRFSWESHTKGLIEIFKKLQLS